jgi:hypothetical protein
VRNGGQDLLGTALMNVREKIMEEEKEVQTEDEVG